MLINPWIRCFYKLFWAWIGPCLMLAGAHAAVGSPKPIVLQSELTQFEKTGPYAEVEVFCKEMARRHPTQVRCFSMGESGEGRPIYGMAASLTGVLTPQGAQRHKLPVVLAIGGTHAGEIDGKDAGLMLFRDLLQQPGPNNPLRHQVLLFVPVFNVDGHEHPRQFNRPNQNGPLYQGERVTTRRINLNRDWVLGQSPEMAAMLRLINQWDPLVTVDLHATDGLRYRHDVSLSISPMFTPDAELREATSEFQKRVLDRITAKGHFPLSFTPVMVDRHNPAAGFMVDADSPRYSHVYAVLRNRLGILVEDYAWEPYNRRVQTAKDVLESILELVSAQGKELLATAWKADRNLWWHTEKTLPLDWQNDMEIEPTGASPSGEMDIRGYEYTIHEQAPIVDGRHITYHIDKPTIWTIPYYARILPTSESTVKLPALKGGYLVPAGWAAVVRPYLDKHHIQYQVLASGLQQVQAEELSFEEGSIRFENRSYQGMQRITAHGKWVYTHVDLLKGSIWVPLDQPKAVMLIHMLEPSGPDSLSSWGLFNAAYEITDHISDHRSLEIVEWMYQMDDRIKDIYGPGVYTKLPFLRESYDTKLNDDDLFRNAPESRLEFWLNEIPHHDPTYNRYPIFRTDTNIPQWMEHAKKRPSKSRQLAQRKQPLNPVQ